MRFRSKRMLADPERQGRRLPTSRYGWFPMQAFTAHKRYDSLTLLCGSVLLLVLAADLVAPLRLSMTVIYVSLLLLLWYRQRSWPVAAIAMLVTAVAGLDLVMHTQQIDPLALAGAGINLLAVWFTAGFVLRYPRRPEADFLELSANEEKYRALFEHAPVGIITVRDNGRIQSFNSKACDLFGYSPDVFSSLSVEDLVPDSQRHNHASLRRRYMLAPTSRAMGEGGDLYGRREDGSVFPLEISLYPVHTSAGTIAVAHIADITERKKAEEKFRSLLEAAPDAIVIVDKVGVIQRVNRQTETLFGYSARELLGKKVEVLMPQRFRERHSGHRMNFFLAPKIRGMGQGLELFGETCDGREFPVEISLSPLETDEGLLISAAIRDVSERKRAEERFRSLIAAVDDAIIVADASGNIIDWNPAASRVLGWQPEEILGHPLTEIMPERYHEPHRAGLWRYLETGAGKAMGKVLELAALTKGGTEIPIELSLANWEQEGKQFFCGVLRDMSWRKQAEENLKRYARQLEITNKELEQFAYIASHDLQEPLRTVSSFVQLLAEDCNGKLGPEADTYIRYISQGSERMSQLVKGLLDYSRLGRDQQRSSVDSNALLKTVLDDLKTTIEAAGASVTVEDLPTIMGAETELRRLFQNLIANAVKFHRPDVAPRVTVSARRDNGHWVFAVADNGIGIADVYRDKIFRLFQRLHAQHEYSGTGIGLAHCKKIVDSLGGRIWVESVVGEGSTFYFSVDSENDAKQTELHSASG